MYKRQHIAHLLVSTEFTLNQISEQTNYQTKFSLAKAFKKHFGVSTSQYREKYKPMYDEQHAVITPEIRSILPMKVFCIEVGEKYKDELRYKLIWNRLTNYAKQHNEEKLNYKFVSLSTVSYTHLDVYKRQALACANAASAAACSLRAVCRSNSDTICSL